MIYKFKSAASADVIMLGPQGDTVLRLLGREPAAKGIVDAGDLAAAIAMLREAIAREGGRSERQSGTNDGDEPDAAVSLRRRLWPIIDLFERAAREQVPVVWGV